jgi:hypothetical protein
LMDLPPWISFIVLDFKLSFRTSPSLARRTPALWQTEILGSPSTMEI